MNSLQHQQVRWDHEGQTIAAGSRAFLPDRPAGELGMIEGTALVLAILALAPFIAAVLP